MDNYDAQLANMHDAIAYFQEQYDSDRVFARRVDEAALRVIHLKLKLYPEFAAGAVEMPPLAEPTFGQGVEVTQAVAEQAVTLLYPPSLEELNERLPRAPLKGEPIVIFTDARRVRDCFDCDYYSLIPTDALQREILRRYGPDGTGQIGGQQIISFSFDDLKLFLGVPGTIENSDDPVAAEERAAQVRALVEGASWILLVMQDINLSPVAGTQNPRFPESDAARLLLDAAAGSLVDKRVVAFAFNVPYQLDTTEVSKLSAAYGLYSKQLPFIEVAARALFREITPTGAPPVTVEGTNYDLPSQLEPAPDQPLTLTVLSPPLTQRVEPPLEVEVVTSVILDRNGHPVPDGTQVDILGTWEDEQGNIAPRVTTVTHNGVATGTLSIREEGTLQIKVVAVQAESDEPLTLTFANPTPTASPTTPATATPRATATRSAPLISAATTTDVPPAIAAPPVPGKSGLSGRQFGIGLLGLLSIVVVGIWVGPRTIEGRIRVVSWAVIAAMSAYSIWAILGGNSDSGALMTTIVGAVLGVVAALRYRVAPSQAILPQNR